MSYANLGQWLKDNNFTDAAWYNDLGAPQWYQFHPEFQCFDGIGQPHEKGFDLRYGDGSLRNAKGYYDGRPHGGNTDLIQALIRLPSNPLRFDDNQGYVLSTTDKVDLNYVPGAWKYLISLAAANGLRADLPAPGKNEDTPTDPDDLTPIDARIEELRSAGLEILGGYKNYMMEDLHDILKNRWSKLAPFVAAGLKAYRKLIGG